MTVIYVVAAWVAVQVASEAFPAFNIPEGAIRYVWVAVLIGFPFAVLFSWKYDFTASGIQRTPAAHEDVAADRSLTRVDYGVLAALGLVMLATVFSQTSLAAMQELLLPLVLTQKLPIEILLTLLRIGTLNL